MAEKKVKFDYQRRHHDRSPARRPHRRRDRADRRVLQLRHQRPHPDRARHQPRRHGQLPHALHRERNLQEEPLRHASTRPASASSCKIAVDKGRSTRPDIKLGICGEHGGDPDSVKFCHTLGLELRELLALPRPRRPPRRRPGRDRGEARGEEVRATLSQFAEAAPVRRSGFLVGVHRLQREPPNTFRAQRFGVRARPRAALSTRG